MYALPLVNKCVLTFYKEFLQFILYVPFLSFRVVTPRALKIVLRLAVTADFDETGLRACDPAMTPFLPFRGKEALRLPEI
ncbi:hypothetical protein ACH3XW_45625 [Acanthocheilonema viteae]